MVCPLHVRLTVAGCLVLGLALGACEQGREAPGGLGPRGTTVGAGGGGGRGFQPTTCSLDLVCGGELLDVRLDTPNVYFVLDASGSMSELEAPSGDSRFELVRGAALTMVGDLGPLINVGAAVFPRGELETDPCGRGRQVMPVRPGDAEGSTDTLDAFRVSTNIDPVGGTPVAATLDALRPTLVGLDGKTLVLLLTDGGPNCNTAASCDESSCIPNIEGDCAPGDNCCAEDHETGGPQLCLDEEPTRAAVAALRAEGIDVYVIGIPGSEAYGELLDALALAGGTARENEATLYHRVEELSGLAEVFAGIAAENIDCEIPLDPIPESPELTNVYLDCDPILRDPVNGWTFGGEGTTAVLNGTACAELKTGEIEAVRVLYGCPTEVL